MKHFDKSICTAFVSEPTLNHSKANPAEVLLVRMNYDLKDGSESICQQCLRMLSCAETLRASIQCQSLIN